MKQHSVKHSASKNTVNNVLRIITTLVVSHMNSNPSTKIKHYKSSLCFKIKKDATAHVTNVNIAHARACARTSGHVRGVAEAVYSCIDFQLIDFLDFSRRFGQSDPNVKVKISARANALIYHNLIVTI